jgi:alpha-tubulin suppressor-like RCC1 family protein
MSPRIWLLSSVALASVPACGDGMFGPGTSQGSYKPCGTVSSTIPSSDSIEIGRAIVIVGRFSGGAACGGISAWMSSDTSVAVVYSASQYDATGSAWAVVIGVGPGPATILLQDGGHHASTEVRVVHASGGFATVSSDAGTCALGSDGHAYCWGEYSLVPTRIWGPGSLTAVSAGRYYSCALPPSGWPRCWQRPEDDSYLDYWADSMSFVSLTAERGSHICALTSAGAAYCWGSDRYGQLGEDTVAATGWLVAVSGDHVFQSIATGDNHTCALDRDGAAWCWGQGSSWQLGNDSLATLAYVPAPVPVLGGLTFAQLSTGANHTCAVTTDGTAYCWGANAAGQLGTGDTIAAHRPRPVSSGLRFRTVTAGDTHSCGVTTDGLAWCWGSNTHGALGSASSVSTVPVVVEATITWRSVSAGKDHTCGLADDGIVYCWGAGQLGQLGTGSTVNQSTPQRVSGQP